MEETLRKKINGIWHDCRPIARDELIPNAGEEVYYIHLFKIETHIWGENNDLEKALLSSGNIYRKLLDAENSLGYQKEIGSKKGTANVWTRTDACCIYKVTHKKTGWSYIGQTSQSPPQRWHQHLDGAGNTGKVHARYEDIENWTFEVLEVGISSNEIQDREKYYIKLYDSVNNGYNSQL